VRENGRREDSLISHRTARSQSPPHGLRASKSRP
jgi:hypothetical protein